MPSLPLYLKARFYVTVAVVYKTARFYAWHFGVYLPKDMPVLSFRRMDITTCFFILCIYWFAKFFHVQVNHHAPIGSYTQHIIYIYIYIYIYIKD